jgi:hypothetical protein
LQFIITWFNTPEDGIGPESPHTRAAPCDVTSYHEAHKKSNFSQEDFMTGCEITPSPYFKLERYLKKSLKKITLLYHKSFGKSDSLFAICIVVGKMEHHSKLKVKFSYNCDFDQAEGRYWSRYYLHIPKRSKIMPHSSSSKLPRTKGNIYIIEVSFVVH